MPHLRPSALLATTLLAATLIGRCPCAAAPPKPLELRAEVLKQTSWRAIGPATMGGRIADIAPDPKQPYTCYVALATGGLIKTVNDGTTWTPVFDHESAASVGAVAVAPSDDKTVWAGTGESNGRNSSSWGDGVYKSTDGGATWKNMGLKDTHEIARIAIDPADPNVVYVAAAGHLWGPNRERGLFKTADGGKSWRAVLAPGPEVGAIDVALGAGGVVLAATYQRLRTAWSFQGQGEGSAIYKSVDAGKTWKRLSSGLPAGPLGRIGVSVCQSKPATVYAVIEDSAGGTNSLFDSSSRHGGVFRSDDAGDTWKRTSGTAPRGFYFGQIRVDPSNAERVYVLGFDLAVSEDGGKTFNNNGSPGVHSDLHALWIDPAHSDHMLLGTDGGLYATHDRAKTWDFVNNFPMGEFYDVSTDMRTPFWVYGGLQDNGSWMGPSAVHADSGPQNGDWVFITDSDGSYVVSDPADPDIVYAEGQGGDASRFDFHIHREHGFHPNANEGEPAFRFSWNAPLAVSRWEPGIVYLAGNRLFRYTNGCTEWTAISPDLTKQIGQRITSSGSGAETYGTIVALAESPIQHGLFWCGTDDGNIQVTQDGGIHWADVTGSLPEKLRTLWVSRIEASRVAPGRAYAAIDGHRSEDRAPYLLVTEDFGKSWRSIAGNLPAGGPVQTIREDPVNPDLLFVGTEFGAFASFDRGGHWHKLGSGMPTVAVDDLTIQPRDHALVAATHGRSLFVVDNIEPLEAMTAQNADAELLLFPIPPAAEFLRQSRNWFGAPRIYKAENPPDGVEVVYWMKSLADEAPSIKITDAAGKQVAELSGDRFPGVARMHWDLHGGAARGGRRFFGGGGERPFVKPGVYTVTLQVGKEKRTQTVQVSGPAALSQPGPGEEDNTLAGRSERR